MTTDPLSHTHPDPDGADQTETRYHENLVRGALVNTVGLVGRLLQPLFIIAVTWLFGPATIGAYFLATFLGDIALAGSVSGFVDASTVLGSRYADSGPEASKRLHDTLGTSLRWVSVIVLGIAAAVGLWAPLIVRTLYPEVPELTGALRLVGVAVPFMAWSQLAIAATKARMRMEYDAAVLGFFNPLARLAFAGIAWGVGGGLQELMLAIVGAEIATLCLAGFAFAKHFDVRATLRSAFAARSDRELLAFAFPQSLNMTFNRYLTRIDVLMLAAMGFGTAQIAFYATAGLVTANLRSVRLVFSSSLAPVAARHHHAGEMGALEAVLNRVSRWTTTLIVPIVLALVVFRGDVLRFVDESYVGDNTFMAVLLISPLVGCALGLAGNCIVYTGHTGWTLANSLIVAALNTAFNFVLIPRWGLIGAAAGTAGAATLVALLQLVELRRLEGIGLRIRSLWRPFVGLVVAGFVLAYIWDPAEMPGAARIAWGLGLPIGFFLLMAALGHPEVVAVWRKGAGSEAEGGRA